MEFSTVQKVVQIVDNDSDVNSARAPFKEIVIRKDATNKKYDYNVEQNFAANAAAAENSWEPFERMDSITMQTYLRYRKF